GRVFWSGRQSLMLKLKLMHKLIVPASLVFFSSFLSAQTPEQIEFFEKKIRPILAGSCSACHNAKATTAGLDLSTTAGIRYAVQYGGEAGKLISQDKPEESLLIQVIEYAGRLKMPPAGKLKEEQLDDVRAWVHAGAPVPADLSVKAQPVSAAAPAAAIAVQNPAPRTKREFTDAEKNFWAFRKFSLPPLPAVKDTAWVKSPL